MTTSSALFCPSCGKAVPAGARFCVACGSPAITGPGGGLTVASSAGTMGAGATTGGLTEAERQLQLQQLLVEATLGEFEILGELGRGGMATVFLAHDLPLDRKVAVKVIAPALLSSPGAAERFKREARTAAALSHPHIIPIHAVRETQNLLFFVMKFVEGRPLDGIIRERGPLPIRMIQAILIEVGQALAYAHRRNIVHRDIKPANIMLDGDGWAMVTDFGIAKVLESDALTVSGAMIGTPYYMSPEQCSGKAVAGSSDQYSLGVVAYEMLTGHPPFSGETIMEIMKGHFFEAPAPVAEGRPDCPPALAAAITRMLAKEPAERWASMDEAVAAMDATPLAADDPVRSEMIALARTDESLQQLSKLSVPVSPVPRGWSRPRPVAASISGRTELVESAAQPEPEPEPPPVSRWKKPLAFAAGVALLAAAGAAGAVYFRNAHTAPPPAVEVTAAPLPAATDSAAGTAQAPAEPAAAVAAPAAPKDNPEASSARREQDSDEYLTQVEDLLNREWQKSNPASMDVSQDENARFRLMVKPNGTLDDLVRLDPNSPLTKPAFACMIGVGFPELPASLGRGAGLPVRVTFTKHGVSAVAIH